jgi:hypothetical protein
MRKIFLIFILSASCLLYSKGLPAQQDESSKKISFESSLKVKDGENYYEYGVFLTSFDPEDISNSKIKITIRPETVIQGISENRVEKFLRAVFSSSTIESTDTGYKAVGNLYLYKNSYYYEKGNSQPVRKEGPKYNISSNFQITFTVKQSDIDNKGNLRVDIDFVIPRINLEQIYTAKDGKYYLERASTLFGDSIMINISFNLEKSISRRGIR